MRVKRANQAQIGDRRARTKEKIMDSKMCVQIAQQSFVAGFNRRYCLLIYAEHWDKAAKCRSAFFARFILLLLAAIGQSGLAKFAVNPFLIIVPAVVHGRDNQPFIAKTFE